MLRPLCWNDRPILITYKAGRCLTASALSRGDTSRLTACRLVDFLKPFRSDYMRLTRVNDTHPATATGQPVPKPRSCRLVGLASRSYRSSISAAFWSRSSTAYSVINRSLTFGAVIVFATHVIPLWLSL
ncbi:hypothetical protein BV25DRAFT_1012536 [Artomyces pyxidatus]|uniref:Uncharacterized protein n=1 Tax=Artomyces pyxidatus TaxID=48021 RepID=A0ACB8SU03_9AGAM|nr:hypothetical protein BV25DRAFT_1012536 [Artomyces pyxidatus]